MNTQTGQPDVASPSLETKVSPSQDRARATFELIIEITGELLADVGVERLSTNMICDRANITPPALYRYFPNKYAILREMGRRLMEAEDAVVLAWLAEDNDTIAGPLETAVAQRAELMGRVRQVVRQQPGGVWILRAMRAIPLLNDVRTESVSTVAEALTARLVQSYPSIDVERARVATTLTTTLTSLANEMIIENPALEVQISEEMSRMVTLYYRDLLFGPGYDDAGTRG